MKDIEPRDTAWMTRAACRGMPLALFYPPPVNHGRPRADALTTVPPVCRGCPVRTDCLEYDLDQPPSNMHGTWGGMSYRARRDLYRSRQRRAGRERAAAREAS